jgi:RNA polymerase sigma factor (sigma-70 family)
MSDKPTASATPTDRQLLAEYASSASSAAFSEIVERYSGKVYGACLAILGNVHEAEDAAQATFLVLVRKAGGLSQRETLAGWLFLTASNVARNARKHRARRVRRERENAEMKSREAASAVEKLSAEHHAGLYPALASLPTHQRDALVLRYIRGLSREEAAREAGCPTGTMHSRARAGLDRLRRKLKLGGAALSAVAIGNALGQIASVEVPAGLSAGITAACLGKAAAAPAAAALAKGALQGLAWAKIKLAAVAVTLAATVGGGGGLALRLAAAEPAAPAVKSAKIASVPKDARLLLVSGSPCRYYLQLRKPAVSPAAFKAAGKSGDAPKMLPIKKLHGGRPTPDIQHLETAPPPADWKQPGFDDSDWPREMAAGIRSALQTGTLCIRSRFAVDNPATVSALYLSLDYMGGVIVYVNGTEVTRAHLPQGRLSPDQPGELYPNEAWVDAKGKMLNIPHKIKNAEDKARVAKRRRSLGPLKVPAQVLRKGVNVLAIEVRRSDYHPVALGWWIRKNLRQGVSKNWTPGRLLRLELHAAGSGFKPNLDRPAAIQVWNADLHNQIERIPHGVPGVKTGPVLLVGARGGSFSGIAVLSAPADLKNVKAEISALQGTGGTKLPAAAVKLRYLAETNISHQDLWGRKAAAFNEILEKAPAEVKAARRRPSITTTKRRKAMGLPPSPPAIAVLPVLVTVKVPPETAAGSYAGKLTVSAAGLSPVTVPVRLTVANWKLPPPLKLRTHMGLFQSPPTLAKYYKVKLWSEEHWKLMDKSFAMLGELGNDLVNIPVSCQTQFGNDEGMVHWVRQADGSYDYDFTVFDRYIKLVKKHLGVPRYVALHVWHAGAWKTRPADEKNEVLVIDKKTGKREYMQVPVFGTPQSKKFWTPVLHAIRKRLATQGMDKSICLGVLSDGTAPPATFKMFAEILPAAGWTRGCHSTTFSKKPYGLKGGGKCVYHEFCYGLGLYPPEKRMPKIHAQTGPGAAWFRGEKDYRLPLFAYRTMPERGLYCDTSGIGRLGLDLWALPIGKKHGRSTYFGLFNRWPHSTVSGHGDPTLVALATPGKDGPQHTLRFELVREGLQEAEALILVSEAMHDHAAKIGPKLAAECRALLTERINACRITQGISESYSAGWQKRSAKLYNLAARLAGKLK